MTTAADLIERARTFLYQTSRDPINRLNGAVISSDTTLNFDYELKSLVAGAVIEADLELMYVWSVDTAAKQAVVERGIRG